VQQEDILIHSGGVGDFLETRSSELRVQL